MNKSLSVRFTTIFMTFCILFTGLPIISAVNGSAPETFAYAAGSVKSTDLASQKKARALISKYADIESYKKWSEYDDLSSKGKSEMKKLAKQATKNCRTDREKIKAVYNFVAQNLFYKSDKKNTPDDPYSTWKKKYGVCHNYAMLSKYLLNAAGVACMYICSDIPGSVETHAYNAAYDSQNERWIYFDACWASYNSYDNKYWTSNGTKRKSWFKVTKINDKYFDLSASEAASLEQHGISSIDYMVKSGSPVVYRMEISKNKWRYPDKWRMEAFGIKSTKVKETKVAEKLGGVPVSIVDLEEIGIYNTTSLRTITIPASISRFGSCGFFWTHPVTLIMEGNPPVKYPEMIEEMAKGSKVVYRCSNTASWKSFKEMIDAENRKNIKFEVIHGEKKFKAERLATEKKDGYKEYRCVVCGKIFRQVIPATGVKKTADKTAVGTADKAADKVRENSSGNGSVKEATDRMTDKESDTLPPNPLTVKRTSEGQVSSQMLKDHDVIVVPLKAENIIEWVKFSICGGDDIARSVVKLNSSTGWFTVKKGTKPGKYNLTVEVSNKGYDRYQPVSKKFDIVIEVTE